MKRRPLFCVSGEGKMAHDVIRKRACLQVFTYLMLSSQAGLLLRFCVILTALRDETLE